jgi:serine/threonine protein kinase HipA of HipAB toxin-antitoxin module
VTPPTPGCGPVSLRPGNQFTIYSPHQWFGRHGDWLQAAAALESARRITTADAQALRWQWLFGRLIGNTDMHFGNVSFTWGFGPELPLAPAYDMLPMRWAPVREELNVEPVLAASRVAENRCLFASERNSATGCARKRVRDFALHARRRILLTQCKYVRFGDLK